MGRAVGFTNILLNIVIFSYALERGDESLFDVFRCWMCNARCHNRCTEVLHSLLDLAIDLDP